MRPPPLFLPTATKLRQPSADAVRLLRALSAPMRVESCKAGRTPVSLIRKRTLYMTLHTSKYTRGRFTPSTFTTTDSLNATRSFKPQVSTFNKPNTHETTQRRQDSLERARDLDDAGFNSTCCTIFHPLLPSPIRISCRHFRPEAPLCLPFISRKYQRACHPLLYQKRCKRRANSFRARTLTIKAQGKSGQSRRLRCL